MNYAHFTDWTKDKIEEMVHVFGVPREAAENLMRYLRNGSIAAEAEARNDAQFLLDFRKVGSTAMAQRHGTTPQNMRKKRKRLLRISNPELRAGLRDEA